MAKTLTKPKPITKTKLEKLLADSLGLREPRFQLEKWADHFNGSVISQTFKGKSDRQRQEMLWNALQANLGETANATVGMILAYTPEEWDGPVFPIPKKSIDKSSVRRSARTNGHPMSRVITKK